MHRRTSLSNGITHVFRPSRASAIGLLVLLGLSIVTALSFRYGLIENAALGLACDASGASFLCTLRQNLVWTFNANLFGGVALGSAAVTVVRPSVAPMAIAIVTSALGLVLYNTAVAAFASGLLILSFARLEPGDRASSKA